VDTNDNSAKRLESLTQYSSNIGLVQASRDSLPSMVILMVSVLIERYTTSELSVIIALGVGIVLDYVSSFLRNYFKIRNEQRLTVIELLHKKGYDLSERNIRQIVVLSRIGSASQIARAKFLLNTLQGVEYENRKP